MSVHACAIRDNIMKKREWTACAVPAGLKFIKIKPIKWYIQILY